MSAHPPIKTPVLLLNGFMLRPSYSKLQYYNLFPSLMHEILLIGLQNHFYRISIVIGVQSKKSCQLPSISSTV